MISSWCTYRARRMDAQMRFQDARIMTKEKMTTNNLWYCHPSSLVKYLPALREVKKQTQTIWKNGCATRMELIHGTFKPSRIWLKGIRGKTKRARKGSEDVPLVKPAKSTQDP